MHHLSPGLCTQLPEMLDSYRICPDFAVEIEDHLTPATFEKGAVIFPRGSSADLLFLLLRGFVKLYLPRKHGSAILVDLARPGELLTFATDEGSKGHRQILEAQALTKCSVGLFTREHLMQVLGRLDHQTAIDLFLKLNTAWSRMFERHTMFLGSSFRVRLEMVLDRLGARFGIEDKRGTLLVPELDHEDLAEMIGSSRPTVSELIGEMTKEGVLARSENGRFILCTKTRHSATKSAPNEPCEISRRSNSQRHRVEFEVREDSASKRLFGSVTRKLQSQTV